MNAISRNNYRMMELFRYRDVWMGFAIIWIIFYHSEFPVNNTLLWMFKNVGYCGVDIFFFASGLGCFYSYKKDPHPWRFLLRRIRRIIPVYWIFLTLLYLYEYLAGTLRPQYIISNYLCIEYFKDFELDTSFNWYMGAIWIMYLLVPFFFSYIEQYKQKSKSLIPVLLLISMGFWHSDHLILLGTRIPVFFLGMYYEYLALNETELDGKSLLIHFGLFALGFVILVPMRLLITDNAIMWGCGFLFYPFLLMTPFICIAISLICMRQNRLILFLKSILQRAGNYSLELYLTHHFVFEAGLFLLKGTLFYKTRLFWIMLYILVIPMAYLLRVSSNAVKKLPGLKK